MCWIYGLTPLRDAEVLKVTPAGTRSYRCGAPILGSGEGLGADELEGCLAASS